MALAAAAIVAALVVATLAVAAVESWAGITDASAAYLLAVVAVAVWLGTVAAVITAVGAFFLYNALFIEPIGTLLVSDPREWLNLLLFLFLGLVVGQLAGRQRERAESALLRERQARALYEVSRALAAASSAREALPAIVGMLSSDRVGSRAWISLSDAAGPERPAADSGGPAAPAVPASHRVVRRAAGNEPPAWVRVHDPRYAHPGAAPSAEDTYRVPIESPGGSRGSVWVTRPRSAGPPGRGDTRVLLSIADQVGQALERDRLAEQAVSAAVARRSEAAKTALLDSVAHDLRTPLAAIRAAAGSLADPEAQLDGGERLARAAAIDRDAARLSRLVTNLLDLSRLEGGDLRGRPAIMVVEDLIADAVDRHADLLAGRPVTVEVAEGLPPVVVDAVFIDQVLANLLENVAAHTPAGTAVRISASMVGDDRVRVTVEDAGAGVAEAALASLFVRAGPRPAPAGRGGRGSGIGLVVVRGLVEAMGGTVSAARSALGGLRVDVDVPVAPAVIGAPEGAGQGGP
ncbi:MAG: histidine kinase [Chloroflexi bacterium]|nr:histidine kinase [Chloroflexota bacterium]